MFLWLGRGLSSKVLEGMDLPIASAGRDDGGTDALGFDECQRAGEKDQDCRLTARNGGLPDRPRSDGEPVDQQT
jgi:hypothetical protein